MADALKAFRDLLFGVESKAVELTRSRTGWSVSATYESHVRHETADVRVVITVQDEAARTRSRSISGYALTRFAIPVGEIGERTVADLVTRLDADREAAR